MNYSTVLQQESLISLPKSSPLTSLSRPHLFRQGRFKTLFSPLHFKSLLAFLTVGMFPKYRDRSFVCQNDGKYVELHLHVSKNLLMLKIFCKQNLCFKGTQNAHFTHT